MAKNSCQIKECPYTNRLQHLLLYQASEVKIFKTTSNYRKNHVWFFLSEKNGPMAGMSLNEQGAGRAKMQEWTVMWQWFYLYAIPAVAWGGWGQKLQIPQHRQPASILHFKFVILHFLTQRNGELVKQKVIKPGHKNEKKLINHETFLWLKKNQLHRKHSHFIGHKLWHYSLHSGIRIP